ncbi:hypothetical protein COOONC_22456 [Cooperia oncophora]
MLVARCGLRMSSWLVHRRHISLSSASTSFWRNTWKNVKGFLTQDEQENFNEESIRKAHRSDDLSEKDWLLIYRDKGASQSFILVGIAFPVIIGTLCVIGYDIYTNEQRDRFDFVQRLLRDVEEIGLFAIVPGFAAVLVVLTVIRMQQLRIMRIYQNRKSIDDYLAIGSRSVLLKHRVCLCLFRLTRKVR